MLLRRPVLLGRPIITRHVSPLTTHTWTIATLLQHVREKNCAWEIHMVAVYTEL